MNRNIYRKKRAYLILTLIMLLFSYIVIATGLFNLKNVYSRTDIALKNRGSSVIHTYNDIGEYNEYIKYEIPKYKMAIEKQLAINEALKQLLISNGKER
ncbi:hypothetical protein [Cysteiniphilum sp. SYW-8]|uniref:hypothetical protein n=1 Tax=Cysteiniphilum sp. SYW-8 TaxID=2610890 RepID=UPI00123DC354|nr:hypothetical protein [Cysteiniphilum sp. SYW-8]